ncbi:MAG: hypothetical protein ACUVWP_01965 [bacterium]
MPIWIQGYLRVAVQKDNDLWLGSFQVSLYIAKSGSNDPDMKVSLKDVYIYEGEHNPAGLGVTTRFSSNVGYAAIYSVNNNYPVTQFLGSIYLLKIVDDDLKYYQLATKELFEPIYSVSITAKGYDPVHISAWFDEHNIVFIDERYNLNGGYGGVYNDNVCGRPTCLDDFVEETTTDIQTESIGCIKALFR